MEASVKELEQVRSKLMGMADTLTQLLQSNASYPDLMAQLNTVQAQIETIKDFDFANLLLFAHILPQTDPDFYPRVLLRTKLGPEVEDDMDETIQKYLDAGTPVDKLDSFKIQEEINTLELRMDQLNSYRQQCMDIVSEFKEEADSLLKPKLPTEKEPEPDGLEEVLQWMASGPKSK